ncbi:MAG: T9SS type A sorting domain-containing protein [bacterium]
MKKTKVLIVTVFQLLIFNQNIHSQNWEPLGYGFYLADILYLMPDTVNNQIYAAGSISHDFFGGNPFRGIALWDGNTWSPIGNPLEGGGIKHGLGFFRDTLYSSGFFYNNSGFKSQLAKWNGSYWDTIPDNSDLGIYTFVEKEGELYFGGSFHKCGSDSTFLLGKYDGNQLTGMSVPYHDVADGSSRVNTMLFFRDTLFVAGDFEIFFEPPIADFSYCKDHELHLVSELFSQYIPVHMNSMVVFQDQIYIGGYFSTNNGFPSNSIMKWNGSSFEDVGGGANDFIMKMEVYKDELYAVGYFTEIGGCPCQHVAKWNGQQWKCLNYDVFDTKFVNSFCILNDELYVSGYFKKIGTDSIFSIAKLKHPLSSIEKHNTEVQSNFSLSPNPAHDFVKISITEPATEEIQVFVSDCTGRIVLRSTIPKGETACEIGLERIRAGVYLVSVSGSLSQGVMKLVKNEN